MSDDELAALAADIAKNGLQQPLVLLKDELLDGPTGWRRSTA
jgi:ParB-like chromosome segregation protein Spo0J